MKIHFRPAEIFRGTQIFRQAENLAYAYETNNAAADADGAPNAYHPGDLGKNCTRDTHIGLDCLGNAGYPKTTWWRDVLVADPRDPSKAFVQPSGPFKGFFVAMTSLRAPNGDKFSTSSYVDATKVPFVVIPSGFDLPHVAGQGDVGIATHLASGKMTPFIVGDSGGGSDAKLGEASIALLVALGGRNPNPRTGAGLPKGAIQYILFPGSRKRGAALWPRTNEDIRDQAFFLASHTQGIESDQIPTDEPPPGPMAIRARTDRAGIAPGKPPAKKRSAKSSRESKPKDAKKRASKTATRRPPKKKAKRPRAKGR
jgi:Fungal chitosanase of glycosyl hydrolase group 75